MSVRVRIAPSPTGPLHIGTVRTALFNWLFARHHGGKFILRVEDTDQSRYVPGALELIFDGLRWLGLDWDEGPEVGGPYGPYFQSERLEIYRDWANWLVENGKAYRCYCTPERLERLREISEKGERSQGYDRRCRYLTDAERQALHDEHNGVHVIRFAMPLEGQTVVHDLIRGDIVFDNKELTDLVLMKSDGFPTYHLANVVDDHLMEISHIMRGEEWIATAPIHVQLYQGFGWQMPEIVHVPLILNPSGRGKLSKRHAKIEADGLVVPTLVHEYREEGYLPSALLNFLANTGWHMSGDQEIFSMEEAIEHFDILRLSPAGTAFSIQKLQWLNGVYIREMNPAALAPSLKAVLEAEAYTVDMNKLLIITPFVQERLKTLKDVIPFTRFLWQKDFATPPASDIIPKKMDAAGTKRMLEAAYEVLASLSDFDWEKQEAALRELLPVLDVKPGQLFGALRVVVTAQEVSPPIFQSMQALGRETTLKRIAEALQALDEAIQQPHP